MLLVPLDILVQRSLDLNAARGDSSPECSASPVGATVSNRRFKPCQMHCQRSSLFGFLKPPSVKSNINIFKNLPEFLRVSAFIDSQFWYYLAIFINFYYPAEFEKFENRSWFTLEKLSKRCFAMKEFCSFTFETSETAFGTSRIKFGHRSSSCYFKKIYMQGLVQYLLEGDKNTKEHFLPTT